MKTFIKITVTVALFAAMLYGAYVQRGHFAIGGEFLVMLALGFVAIGKGIVNRCGKE